MKEKEESGINMENLQADRIFKREFGYEGKESFFSPGRVNLIGEYTDIAGGHVLPMAIGLGIEAKVSERKDRLVRVYSLTYLQEFSLDDLCKSKYNWINYVIGEFYVFKKHGIELEHGLDIALSSDLPTGSGLSSSAAIEVLIGTIINEYAGKKVSDLDIVLYSKENENGFMGLSSGVMDQFACKMGKKDQVIFLDTKTLAYKYFSFRLGNYDLVIMNSNKPRKLVESKYNVRVQEMKDGLKDLRPYLQFDDACSLSLGQLEEYKDKLVSNPNSYKRLRHLISDDRRTLRCAELLQEGKIEEFASVLNEGMESVDKDFEVAGYELETLCSEARKAGAIGARMTGAGFGGCALFVSPKEKTEEVIASVKKNYYAKTRLKCECYRTVPCDGARRIG
jgi:galactokinase